MSLNIFKGCAALFSTSFEFNLIEALGRYVVFSHSGCVQVILLVRVFLNWTCPVWSLTSTTQGSASSYLNNPELPFRMWLSDEGGWVFAFFLSLGLRELLLWVVSWHVLRFGLWWTSIAVVFCFLWTIVSLELWYSSGSLAKGLSVVSVCCLFFFD